jgi:hypothetical protein
VFRNGVRVHLDVRVLGLVALEVDLEVALGGEAVSTDVAFERTLACNTYNQHNCHENKHTKYSTLIYLFNTSCVNLYWIGSRVFVKKKIFSLIKKDHNLMFVHNS